MYKVLSIITISLLIITLFIDTSAYCEDNNDNDIPQLKEIVVTATKVEENPLDVPQNVTIITEKQIEESGAKNIADLLDKQAGLQVSDYGPEGAQKTLSIRGSTSAQVLVLVDGVRMNNSQSGGVDLSLIPLDNIERIEIVRGGNSSIYGADAVGGVINIITKKGEKRKLSIEVKNGSYLPKKYVKNYGSDKKEYPADPLDLIDTQKVSFQYSGKISKLNINTTGSFTKANNQFIFKDSNYEDRKRINANLLEGNFYVGTHLPFKNGYLNSTNSFIYSKKGIPGSLSNVSTDAKQENINYLSSINYNTSKFLSDNLTFDVKTSFKYSQLKYTDPPSTNSLHKLYAVNFDTTQEMLYFDSFYLIYGINLEFDSIDSNEIGNKERLFTGVFLESPINLTESFVLQPSLRFDYYSDFGGSLNFKIGAIKNLTNTTSLKSSLSKSFRAPTFNDLYWPESSFVAGNPDLKPETGYSFDFGISKRNKNVKYDAFVFTRYIKNVILWQPGNDGKWRPSNYGEALYPGLEGNLNIKFLKYYNFNLDYTYLYTFVLSGSYTLKDNKRLPYIPVHKLNAGFNSDWGKNLIGFDLNYISLRYTKTANVGYMPSHFILNAHYKHKFRNNMSLNIDIHNLFNEQYQMEDGYPMPGTYIETGIKYKF